MTRLLFVHQNMPGQYREMVSLLGRDPRHEILFLTQRDDFDLPGVRRVTYRAHHAPAKDAYGLSRVWEEAAGAGYGAALAAARLRDEGFAPDLILGHSGWGELTFLRQIWRDVPILGLFEYHHLQEGGPVGFDPQEPASAASPYLLRARNVIPHTALMTVDRGYSPTRWQRNSFPARFHPHLYVCHEGIRTDRLGPDADASIELGRAGRLTRADEVVTYVARNLEPMRGFHVLMRALPEILGARPRARVLIVGGRETSYGRKSGAEGGFRAEMERELGDRLDWGRVHMLGRVPYSAFRSIVQISRCHVYLTMPFVPSWSLLESMAMGAVVVGADVAPVRELVEDGRTGLLADFHDPGDLATKVIQVLADPAGHAELGRAARRDVIARHDFLNRCLPRHLEEMNALLPAGRRIDPPAAATGA
jgi:glycosyltransferase involved in cell wall biosynthesis